MRAARLLLAAAISAAILPCCAGGAEARPDPTAEARRALAAETGLLESARPNQDGPAAARHLAFAEKLDPGYRFPGRRIVGRVATEAGEIGCVLLLPASGPIRGTILGFHGYLAHGAYILGALERLAELGWAAIAADLPGHGFSEGERGGIGDFREYSLAVRGLVEWAGRQTAYELPRPYILFGHSAGGAAVLAALFEKPGAAEGAILLAPLIRPAGSWAAPLAGPLSIFKASLSSRKDDDGYLGVRDMPLSWVRALRRWWLWIEAAKPIELPVLIVQGTSDAVLDWRSNLRLLARKIPGAQVLLLPGRGHLLPVGGESREESLAAIQAFLDEAFP